MTTLYTLEYFFCRIRLKMSSDEHDWSKSARDLCPSSSGLKYNNKKTEGAKGALWARGV